MDGVDRNIIFLSFGEKCVEKCSLKAAITMRFALFGATLNLLATAIKGVALSGDRGNTGTRNSNKLLAEPVPAVLKYLGGESLRGMATVQVTGCSTQPPKLKRVYASPGLATCGSLRGDSAAASQGLAQSPSRHRSDNTRVVFS